MSAPLLISRVPLPGQQRALNPLPVGLVFPGGSPRVPFEDEWESVDSAGDSVIIKLEVRPDVVEIQTGGSIDRIQVESTSCGFGGSRAWWRCPGCHSRRGVLYERDHRWRCRGCLGLPYRSQRVSKLQRTAEKARRLHVALGGTGRLADDLPLNPPAGMRRRTYLKVRLAYLEASQVVAQLLRAAMERRYG